MYFRHSPDIWRDFPELVPGVVVASGIHNDVSVDEQIARLGAIAGTRLEDSSEGSLPEIQAWRRAFSRMGLKPTQYRCASESLLRRFRKEGSLPRIHPLIDLCNAISLAFAVPVAVFDTARIAAFIEVRYAGGDERYLTFGGDEETPDQGEVIFADGDGRAHARRWTNRQSAYSSIQPSTASILIVVEALHASAPADMPMLVSTLAEELGNIWGIQPVTTILSSAVPKIEF